MVLTASLRHSVRALAVTAVTAGVVVLGAAPAPADPLTSTGHNCAGVADPMWTTSGRAGVLGNHRPNGSPPPSSPKSTTSSGTGRSQPGGRRIPWATLSSPPSSGLSWRLPPRQAPPS